MTTDKDIAQLSTEKQRALLKTILEKKASQPKSRPLSFTQERLWFLDRMEENSVHYNVAGGLRLQGQLDIRVLEQSVNAVVARHEILRTNFVEIAGEPNQIIASNIVLTIPVKSLAHLPTSVRLAEAQRIAQAESMRPFNLAVGHLLRMQLLELQPDDHILLFTIHHIVADGWSITILYRELEAFYTAFVQETAVSLPPLLIQYADYAIWQRKQLQAFKLDGLLAYWKDHLKEAPPSLNLPLDFMRPPTPSYRGATHTFTIPAETAVQLHALSRQEEATLFMTTFAVFAILLARYSGQEDMVIGVPIANRTHHDVADLIGFFANTLALRVDLRGNPTVREVVQQIRETCLEGYAHQEMPFEKLVEALQPARNLSHTPLFQVSYSLKTRSSTPLTLPNLQTTYFEFENPTAKFEISLDLYETPAGHLEGVLEYAIDLFTAESMAQMSTHYCALLAAAGTRADTSVWQLPMPTADIPAKPDTHDQDMPLLAHQLFEALEKQRPDAIAVIDGGKELSYHALNKQANQLAHYLRRQGVGFDIHVGIFLDISPNLLIAILAILKAGGALLPLLPPEYGADVLNHDQIPFLITETSFIDNLPASSSRKDILLDQETAVIQSCPHHNMGVPIDPDHLAYITSRPEEDEHCRNILFTHVNLANALQSPLLQWDATTPIRMLLPSLTSDSAILGILGVLRHGGALCIAPKAVNTQAVASQMLAHQITHLVSPISEYKALLKTLLISSSMLNDLQVVLADGELYPPDLFDLHEQIQQQTRLFKVHGTAGYLGWPTYATRSLTEAPYSAMSLEKALPNHSFYILDRYWQPVATAVPGELFIGGSGLARGYHDNPAATAKYMLPDPFSKQPGARMYRTGMIARYTPDGSLEFLGHRDQQTMVDGYPVVLGKIEAILRRFSDVQDAAVVLEDDQLVAYVTVCHPDSPLEFEHLHHALQEQLPAYMVPSRFIWLDTLPHTSDGNINRELLVECPYQQVVQMDEVPVDFTDDPIVQSLIEIWQTILHVDGLNAQSNFFELGGHSLLAIRMNYRIRDMFDVDLPLRNFFETPTIAQLSKMIEDIVIEQLDKSI